MKKLLSFKWLRKTTTRSNRNTIQSTSPKPQNSPNEYYQNLIQQFANQTSNGDITDPDWVIYLPKEQNAEQFSQKDNRKLWKHTQFIPGVPHIRASEIFEIECIAGTEKKCLELVSAEWNNTKVTLKRHILSSCRDAIKADVEILNEIRHPNILLLMATTYTNEHGLVSIFEPIDCSLYNYMHEQGERINIQGIMQIGMKLADALKYCHMRGYIHTAISSHCVYFASDTTIKLGGWELARSIDKVYVERDYEKYLRLENFKCEWHWQTSTIYYGLNPDKKIDVYCLMLLLWEMCTGSVPWNGYDPSNVEWQRKRNVIINLENVPSILHSLLEAGLHTDETKIMLDMDKIGRKLHRLLMIYEEEEKNDMYVNENGNISNDLLYNETLYHKASSTSPTQDKVIKNSFAKQSCHPTMKKRFTPNHLPKPEKEQCSEDSDSISSIKKITMSTINDSIVSPVTKVKTATPCIRCAEVSNMVQDLDEESDARANLKRLKQLIASRRVDFFGSDVLSTSFSYSTPSPKATSSLLSQEKSTDYITCKPASHTIAIEPRCNKSPSEYGGAISKLSYTPRQKTPYMSMPPSIKQAIIQPEILHSDTKNFYESTLWRKEKEICLSRMGRSGKKQNEDSLLLQPTVCITDDDKVQYSPPHAKNADATYIIEMTKKDNCTEDNKKLLKDKSSSVPTKILSTPNQSIKNLKDALDRATEIVRSTTPSKIYTSKLDLNLRECEAVLENLFKTKYNDDQEIKVIKKSTPSNEIFLGMSEVSSIRANNEAAAKHEQIFNQAFINSQTLSSTTKTSFESETSAQNQQSINSQEINRNEIPLINAITSTPQEIRIDERECVNVCPMNGDVVKDSPRRRSLSTKLNNVGMVYTSRNMCKKNMEGSQYTTEDIYIDDEFGSKLNYNLILLNDNMFSDDECLPQTTEL
ncbi:uncharacterized protein LOC105197224 isoform X2 [Solenopsis invicta]|uniref:uncharacterized protein LOC105197224 isoform X2 n=1 Tax=Solenopsis invicta TaxID=13686 RepID=UPI000E33FA9D|nr:uncharacterized protein LOC105197224 isoform X2 [Solenopsis invicta]